MKEPGPLAVECRDLVVAHDQTPAVRSISMSVERGESVALLGPSGSGKTTLLYAIAGFLPVSAGEIRLGGEVVATRDASVPPERRSVGMVFQHYGLWPHLDAQDTVAYPLRRAGLDAGAARQQARVLLAQLRIDHLSSRRPAELSGGEQQRVGLARALARRPAVYLLDEPTAHLDVALKADLQGELAERIRADGAAALHATHDVEEALAVADRVVLLREGVIVQVGAPAAVYARPVDEWAARLTGPAVFIEGERIDLDSGPAFLAGGHRCPLGPGQDDGPNVESGGEGHYLVRPDWVPLAGPLSATVRAVRYRGSHTDYRLETPIGTLLSRVLGPPGLGIGATTSCGISQVWCMSASP